VISVKNSVGRLCLARFAPPLDVAQVDHLAAEIRGILGRLARPSIFCSDTRRVQIFAPDVSDRILAMLRADNPRVERSAVVVGDSSVFALQMERIFRESNNPGRKVFRSVDTIVAWLDEALTPPEREGLRAFLDEDLVA